MSSRKICIFLFVQSFYLSVLITPDAKNTTVENFQRQQKKLVWSCTLRRVFFFTIFAFIRDLPSFFFCNHPLPHPRTHTPTLAHHTHRLFDNIRTRKLKLVDFGLAATLVAGQMLHSACGTPVYSVPLLGHSFFCFCNHLYRYMFLHEGNTRYQKKRVSFPKRVLRFHEIETPFCGKGSSLFRIDTLV